MNRSYKPCLVRLESLLFVVQTGLDKLFMPVYILYVSWDMDKLFIRDCVSHKNIYSSAFLFC